MKILFILAIFSLEIFASRVNITKDLPSITIIHDGKTVKIERIQDIDHKLKNSYIKTSRPTPPFFIQPFTPIKGIKTVGELDVINFIKDGGVLIDARLPKWYKSMTIPTALNLPFSLLTGKKRTYFAKKVLDLLKFKTLLIFDNGPWCQQGVALMKELVSLGYPKDKLLYYRGGMQFWQIVGLTTIKPDPTKLNSITKEYINDTKIKNHIINLAGKQRMLTQKMSKAALALSFDENAKDELEKSITLFGKTLSGFSDGNKELGLPKAKHKDLKDQIEVVKKIWLPFKKELLALLKNKGDISYIIQQNEKLLRESDNLVQIYKSHYQSDYLTRSRTSIVDIAGRERMLSQKITKERFLIDLNIDREQNREKLKKSITLFESSLDALMDGDKKQLLPKPTNKKLKEAYTKVKLKWQKLVPTFQKNSLSISELNNLNQQSNTLLELMDSAVKIAEKVKDY